MTLIRVTGKSRRPRRPQSACAADAHVCRLMETAVAAAFAVPVEAVRMRSRGTACVAFARQTAMYLAHVALGLSYSRIGHMFNRDRTTVAHGCLLVELRRDDPIIDRALELLEAACVGLMHDIPIQPLVRR